MLNNIGSKTGILTVVALCCFAGNSLLCRAALGHGLIGPEAFTTIRLVSGALALALLVYLRGKQRLEFKAAGSWSSGLALFAYAMFFSLSYIRLDAGIGALTLFGVVQVTMIGWSILNNYRPNSFEWIGLTIAVCGLALLTVPGKGSPDLVGLALMAIAGISWGIYSLRGRNTARPLEDTAMNFFRAVPFSIAFLLVPTKPIADPVTNTAAGIALATVSGIVTSGLGYTLWYAALPRLGPTRAAILQLSVPVIALIGSSLLLGETVTMRTIASIVLILGGIGFSLRSMKSS